MGRAPCCDKANVKKGPWSPEEDAKLKSYIEKHGTGGNWIALPQKIVESIKTQVELLRKEHQARRGSNNLKQEFKRGNNHGNLMISTSNTNSEIPYWPELPVLAPVPYSNEEQRFNDHAAIRKFLIKLGGKFSEDEHVIHDGTSLQFSADQLSSTPQLYEQSINYMPSSSSMEASNNSINAQFAQTLYNIDGTDHHLQVLQGQNNLQPELGDLVYSNPQRLDGLEFFYSEDTIDNRNEISTSGESIGWGDMMSALISPPVGPNYDQEMQQGMMQECAFSELRYPGMQ
ncbi:hypothetical protein JRO89_XS07G0094600 [Xanthoceras sorbifolium]|uniref:Uncharacterized protein n=1 Tax=Xanthoceras sorbifolium TaxID=99658 RepID=A0ABQ8HTA4_9ROSI|nr:hypothetical protein JRO89_XS07G0094600 [Xanthoceras sorbifolium]